MPRRPLTRVALDTETTGLGKHDQVISIALVDANNPQRSFSSMVRPTVPIQPSAERIHGMSERDLADAPTWPDVARAARAFLANLRPFRIYAHNLSFDLRMIEQSNQAWGSDAFLLTRDEIADSVCTLRIARRAVMASAQAAPEPRGVPPRRATNLATLYQQEFGEEFEGAHGALADASALARLMRATGW